jgi:cytochrome P450
VIDHVNPGRIADYIVNILQTAIYNLVGKGVLWADGESHKRQRKSISPGFSNVKMREYTPIFFDAAYKASFVSLHTD